jgi:hypothetical protein
LTDGADEGRRRQGAPQQRRRGRGREALFGGPVQAAAGAGEGRRAFFTAAAPPPAGDRPRATPPVAGDNAGESHPPAGKVAVRCASCRHRSVVGPAHLAVLLVPSLWLPRRGYNRLMRCPSCHRPAWCALDWSGFNPLR